MRKILSSSETRGVRHNSDMFFKYLKCSFSIINFNFKKNKISNILAVFDRFEVFLSIE